MISLVPVWASIYLSPLRSELACTGDSEPPSFEDSDYPEKLSDTASGLHAMLVEDQTIIALDTENMLSDMGVARVDAFTSAEGALDWLDANTPDFAVLDVNLGATTSFKVADALLARKVPLIFTTGYGDNDMMPGNLADIPIVRKPYTIEALAAALKRCLLG